MIFKKKILFLLFFIDISRAQPELRFNPFDWISYRQSGSINSISFGDRYAFLGTQNGGVIRFNVRTQRFEEPITKSQGLKSNFVTAVHYSSSGMLWVATINGLHYSFNAEGDWRYISLESLGLSVRNPITKIGDDNKDIWIEAFGQYKRLDGVTGVVLETMVRQNRMISWSSGLNTLWQNPSNQLFDFTFLDGWMQNLNEMIDPYGKSTKITTIAENKYGEIVVGCENGFFFFGDNTMKLMSPFRFGLTSDDVTTLAGKHSFWLGGRNSMPSDGITFFDYNRNLFEHYTFENIINIDAFRIFSSYKYKKNLYLGGDDKIVHLDIKNLVWSQYYLPSGVRTNIVLNMDYFEENLWLGTTNGLKLFDLKSKKFIENKITDLLNNSLIFDLLVLNNFIFIGSDLGLFIYDKNNNNLYEQESFGYTDSEFEFSSFQFNYTALASFRNEVFFANEESVIKLNLTTRKWSKVLGSEIFGGITINALAVNRSYLFLATDNALLQYHLKDKLVEVFNYEFLGNINTLEIDRSNLLIGTSEGIVSFLYK